VPIDDATMEALAFAAWNRLVRDREDLPERDYATLCKEQPAQMAQLRKTLHAIAESDFSPLRAIRKLTGNQAYTLEDVPNFTGRSTGGAQWWRDLATFARDWLSSRKI